MKTTLYILIILSFLSCSQNTTQKSSSNIANQIDSSFTEFNSKDKPGFAIAVIKDDEVLFSKGYGLANLDYKIPITTSTVFDIASVSKQFTIFSILLLEEQGKLSLDDNIRKYVPEVPDFGKTITLKHLATHTSGLRDQWYLLGLAGWQDEDVKTTEGILRLVSNQKELNFPPGEEFGYSNTGYTLLAEVVSRVSNMSFKDFAQENIFTPLKMMNTQIIDDYESVIPNMAYSYHLDSSGYKKSILNNESVGATNVYTTVEDMTLWALNFSNPKAGSKSIFEKMNTKATLNNGDSIDVGLGQFFYNYRGLSEIYHEGMEAGYRTYFSRFPEQHFTVTVFTNSNEIDPYQQAKKVMDIVLKDQLKEEIFSNNETSNNSDTNSLKFEYENDELEKLTGDYYSEELQTQYKIVRKNDHLEIHHIKIGTISIYSIANNLFQDDGEWEFSTYKFIRNDKNDVVEMRFSSANGDRIRNLKFTKVK